MRETLDRMAGGVPHQGIIAVVSEKPVLSLESLLETAREPALVVVLDGVEDPRNLGAILRTAEAAGADGVLLPERHSAGLSETVARASAGALEHVQVARVGNLVQALEALKARGIWVVGFDAAGTERWDAVDLARPVALVLGGEGRGIRRLVREHCDHLVSIPHFGHIGSLNVSVAAGIALYEAVRQRRAVPSGVRPIPARPAAPPQIVGPAPDDAEDGPRRPADAAADARRARRRGRRADGSGDARRPARRRGVGPGAHRAEAGRLQPAAPARRSAEQGSPPTARRGHERRGPPPRRRPPPAPAAPTGPAAGGGTGDHGGAPQGPRSAAAGVATGGARRAADGAPRARAGGARRRARGRRSAAGPEPQRPAGPDGAPPGGGGGRRRRRRRR